jgi:hypothetical protein
MGEKQNQPFQLSVNASLKIDFQGSRVAWDGGLIPMRELDERLGFGEPGRATAAPGGGEDGSRRENATRIKAPL